MTRFKQNKFYNSSKINGNYVAVPLNSDKTTSQIDQGLESLVIALSDFFKIFRASFLEVQASALA